ncbi:MAG: TSUP family transporter [Firmicutes bacterium]|nr:TSUP family transporter [Bacillota bacterium]
MENLWQILLFICPCTFLAGLIDSSAGGGGLISLPAYLVAGLPPHAALATNKCSSTFGTMFSTANFIRNGKINFRAALPAAVMALLGSHIGAKLSMLANETVLRYIMIVAVIAIAIFITVKKDFGSTDNSGKYTKTRMFIMSVIIGFVIGMYDGFFGPGTGTFLILSFSAFAGFDLLTASGNAKLVNLASNVAAFLTFAFSGEILFAIGIPAALTGIAGNIVGSNLALKKGSKYIRPMFILALTLLLLKLIADSFF